MKLSIIVPVYNVAPYLRKCVDSLLAQDYDDYEIILVDDGSADESSAICDEYAASSLSAAGTSPFSEADHSIIPIRVIHQQNGGLSAARNAGLKEAQGEYICYVDSDDYWEKNVLSGLMEQVERDNLDVLRFNYRNVRIMNEGETELGNERRYKVFEPYKASKYVDMKNEIVDGETYLNIRMGYACYAVMFVIKRSLIYKSHMTLDAEHLEPAALDSMKTDSSCLFTPGIHFEDVEWLPRMMLKAKRVNSTQTIVYNYLIRQGSITQTQRNKEKIRRNINDRLLIIDKYKQYIDQNPQCRWLRNMQGNMVVGVLTTIAREFYAERREYIARFKALNVFPLSIADQGKTYARRARIINVLGPEFYSLLMHMR